jgi:uncharacterized membrane protein YciS (DUF1049 family)
MLKKGDYLQSRSVLPAVFISAFLMVILIAGSIFSYFQFKDALLELKLNTARNYSQSLSHSIAGLAITKDYAGMETRLRQSFANEEIVLISVSDMSGRPETGIYRDRDGNLKVLIPEGKLAVPQFADSPMIQEVGEDKITTFYKINFGLDLGFIKIETINNKSDVALIAQGIKTFLIFDAAFFIILIILGIFLWRGYFSVAHYERFISMQNAEINEKNQKR